MFIKMGKDIHLYNLMTKGEMFCNPCKYFRDLEEEQKQRGIGDGNDGGMRTEAFNMVAISPSGEKCILPNCNISFIIDPALKTPIFCMKKVDCEYISSDYRNKLREQFPEHTHALIIHDEREFLENVRFSMKNRAFSHSIFYQGQPTVEFYQFILYGTSDIFFYEPKSSREYYMEIRIEPVDLKSKKQRHFINKSNFYKTMFAKDIFFKDQSEYRIVLPYEQIEVGTVYSIKPFEAELCSLDELVR